MREIIAKIARRALVWLVWILVIGLIATGGVWALRPHAVGPRQPIPFSHYRHAGIREISCYFCHTGADRSPVAGVPELEKCLLCHEVIANRFDPIAKLHEARERNEPIEWVRVYDLPDHAYFNHEAHILKGIDCAECHGDVKSMDRIILNQKLTMGFCVDCHRKPEHEASVDCWTCHR